MHRKVVQEMDSLPVWQAGVNQQPSCSNSPTRVCSQMVIVVFLLLSVAAPEATKTRAASSEGGRGGSLARAAAIFTSKMLATQTQCCWTMRNHLTAKFSVPKSVLFQNLFQKVVSIVQIQSS